MPTFNMTIIFVLCILFVCIGSSLIGMLISSIKKRNGVLEVTLDEFGEAKKFNLIIEDPINDIPKKKSIKLKVVVKKTEDSHDLQVP